MNLVHQQSTLKPPTDIIIIICQQLPHHASYHKNIDANRHIHSLPSRAWLHLLQNVLLWKFLHPHWKCKSNEIKQFILRPFWNECFSSIPSWRNKCYDHVELVVSVAHFAARPVCHQVDVAVGTSRDAVDVSSPGRAVVHAQCVFLIQNHFSLKSIGLSSLVMRYFSRISPKDFTKLSWKLLRKKEECQIVSLLISTWFSSIQYCASGIVWNSTKQYRKDCPIRNESTSIYCLEMSWNHLSESKHEKFGQHVGRCRYICLVKCSKFMLSQTLQTISNHTCFFGSHEPHFSQGYSRF